MKKRVVLLVMVIMLLSAIPVNAGGGIMVTIDDELLPFNGDQGYPTIIEGRTLVPLRAVFEALGATVEYKPASREIKATKGEQLIYLTIDFEWAIVYKNEISGTNVELDVPPTIINGRTYVPLRFVSESLGCTVDYEDTGLTQYINITTSNGAGTQNANGGTNAPTGSALSKFKNENINGQYVDFSTYELVAAEDYQGVNYQGLGATTYENIAYDNNNYWYEIAFFGGVYGVTVESYEYMGAEPEIESLGYLYNTILKVHSSFPNDGSVDIITFTDSYGSSHRIVVEDMSDDKDLILVEDE